MCMNDIVMLRYNFGWNERFTYCCGGVRAWKKVWQTDGFLKMVIDSTDNRLL